MKRKVLVLNNGHIEELQPGDTPDIPNDLDIISSVNGESVQMVKGQQVYIDGVSGQMKLAKSDSAITTRAIGTVISDVINPGVSGMFQVHGSVTLADWTAATGAADLVIGQDYYLSDTIAGQVSTVAPTAAGSFIVFRGIPLDARTMFMLFERPIKL